MDQRSIHPSRPALVIVLVVIFCILAAGTYLGYRVLFVKKPTKQTAPSAVLVIASHPKLAVWKLPFTTFGTVMSRGGVHVSAETDGRITKIVPQKPGIVHKGELLFQVFNQTEKGGLEAQKSQLTYTKRNLARQRQLLKDGAISKNEYDIALQDYNTALGKVKSASGSLSLTNIYAPITGSVGIIGPSVGNYIQKGRRLVDINPLVNMYIKFSIPAFLGHTVHVDDKITFTNPALNHKLIQATIYEIDNRVDVDTRQIMLKAYFTNSKIKLLPGDFVTLTIQVGKPKHVFVVPDTAVKYSLMGTTLYKIIKNKAVEIPIQIFQRRNNIIGITSNALSPSDTIIGDGVIKVNNGTLVRTDVNNEAH